MKYFDIHTHTPSNNGICSFFRKDSVLPTAQGYYAFGIHPWFLEDVEEQFLWLAKAVHHPRVLALGECGLDKLSKFPLELQIEVFRKCAELSEKMSLPLIIHNVRCTDHLIEIKRNLKPSVPWIIHGFRGKLALANECLRHGFYLSFGEKFQEDTLRNVPIERLLLETDESLLEIDDIYRHVAETRGVSLDELTEALEINVRKLFFK